MDVERRAALNEKLSQDTEIQKLRDQLDLASKNQKSAAFPNGVPGPMSKGASNSNRKHRWGSNIASLLYLVWNGVEGSSDGQTKQKKSDVIRSNY